MAATTPTEYLAVAAEIGVAEVVVMEDRARVVRRGRVTLARGLYRVRTEGVAPVVSDKTVTGRLRSGPKGVRLVEARVVRELRTVAEVPSGDPAALNRQLADLNRQIKREGVSRTTE